MTPDISPEAMHIASNARWTERTPDLPVYERPAWHALAACRGMDPDLFMPQRGEKHIVNAAKRVCARCPVAEPCLEYALVNHELGIWGGTGAIERRAMRAGRRVSA